MKTHARLPLLGIVAALAFAASAARAETPASCVKGVDLATLGPKSIVGQGPHGEKAASSEALALSDADVAKIKAHMLINYAEMDDRIDAGWPAYEAALKANKVDYQQFTYPGTMHGFKGLEYRCVAVIGVHDGALPFPKAVTPSGIDRLQHEADLLAVFRLPVRAAPA